MQRREFVKAGLVAGALGPATVVRHASEAGRHHYELRVYETRSDLAPGRIHAFLREQLLPALGRAGAAAVGVFTADIGMVGQSVVLLIDHPTGADALALPEKLEADAAFAAAQHTFDSDAQPPYVRYDARLMRAFTSHPRVEVPPGGPAHAPRLFEMRTYESRDAEALAKKIAMFNEGEIALFRSLNMTPVFFGENLFASRLPSLTYMLTFDDMAAREAAWKAFGSSPEWKRISTDPRYRIEGITTVTSSVFLSPTGYSPIR